MAKRPLEHPKTHWFPGVREGDAAERRQVSPPILPWTSRVRITAAKFREPVL